METKWTAKEKTAAKKIAIYLVTNIKVFMRFPRSRKKEDLQYETGLMDGMKEMVTLLNYIIDDDRFTEKIETMLEIEKDIERMFGKKNWKEIKQHHEKVKLEQNRENSK